MIAVLYVFKFIVWMLIAYGITQIIVEGMIFEGLRHRISKRNEWIGNLFKCMLCTGVWVSFLLSVILWSPVREIFIDNIYDIDGMIDMQIAMEDSTETMEKIMTTFLYQVYLIIGKLKIIFYDGMIGSTIIWFMHIIEQKLSK